jgi:molybdopterin-synthase adenylyltransferase
MQADDKWERYSRQVLFSPIGRSGQEKLLKSRGAVIGLGALGSVSASCLARAGVGYLKLVDRDFVEYSNLQRQILFTEKDAREAMPKALAARDKLLEINSTVRYEALVDDVNHTNIEAIIRDVDLVLDATDNFETRYLINEACVKHGVPWIYGACVAGYGITFSILPGETACLACFLGALPPSLQAETCDTAGVIAPVAGLIASLQAAEALKLLSGARDALNRQAVFYDLWENRWLTFDVPRENRCPVCGARSFAMLAGEAVQRTATLCGRGSIQIVPPHKMNLSLENLAAKLAAVGETSSNSFLVRFKVDGCEMVIFPDGRALIKGAADEKTARSLYARYIGA